MTGRYTAASPSKQEITEDLRKKQSGTLRLLGRDEARARTI